MAKSKQPHHFFPGKRSANFWSILRIFSYFASFFSRNVLKFSGFTCSRPSRTRISQKIQEKTKTCSIERLPVFFRRFSWFFRCFSWFWVSRLFENTCFSKNRHAWKILKKTGSLSIELVFKKCRKHVFKKIYDFIVQILGAVYLKHPQN